jgi:hypothetical protein
LRKTNVEKKLSVGSSHRRGRVTRRRTFTRLFATHNTHKCARRAARCAWTGVIGGGGGNTRGWVGGGEGVRRTLQSSLSELAMMLTWLASGVAAGAATAVSATAGSSTSSWSSGAVCVLCVGVASGARVLLRVRIPVAHWYFLSGNFLFVKVRRERCRRIGPQRIHHDEAQGPEGARQRTLPKIAGRRSEEACRDEAHAPRTTDLTAAIAKKKGT